MRAYMLTLPLVALALPIGSATAQQTWSGTVGLGVGAVPKYIGSDEERVQAIPYLQVAYGQRFVAGVLPSGNGLGLGAYVARRGPLTWMLDVSHSLERRERYGDALAGTGDRSGATSLGTDLTVSRGMFSVGASGMVGIGGDGGATGTLKADAGRTFGDRWIASVGGSATVADRDGMTYEFGITEAQAERRRALIARGDPRLAAADGRAYLPAGGLKQLASTASLGFRVTPRVTAVWYNQASRLSKEAARSPLVRERVSTSSGLLMMYRW